jgi:putative glycosyltransferase (TIGR04372 family)
LNLHEEESENGNDDRFIDARNLISNNELLDFAIQKRGLGYFGADSGPAWLFLLEKKPVGLVNMIPLNHDSPIDPQRLLVLPKRLYSQDEKRELTIDELIDPRIALMRSSEQYRKAHIEPIDNTIEELSEFLEEWYSISFDGQFEKYDSDRMKFLRERLNVPHLPSIAMSFLSTSA